MTSAAASTQACFGCEPPVADRQPALLPCIGPEGDHRAEHEHEPGEPDHVHQRVDDRLEVDRPVLVDLLGDQKQVFSGEPVVKHNHPSIKAKGIDVNPRALEHARRQYPDVEFALQDANDWTEPPHAWDGVLTMSLLDHVPNDAAERLARNMSATARFVICFELWDGEDAERGLYKYSRDNCRLFESLGVKTLRWELAAGQYDTVHSALWLYVGESPRTNS